MSADIMVAESLVAPHTVVTPAAILSQASWATHVLARFSGDVTQFIPSGHPLPSIFASHAAPPTGAVQVVLTSSTVTSQSLDATHMSFLLAGVMTHWNPEGHPTFSVSSDLHGAPTFEQSGVMSFVFLEHESFGTHLFL